MDFLKNSLEKKNNNDGGNGGNHDNKPTQPHKPSNSEVMSSAKTVAEAAKSSFGPESDKVDKAKVADASAILLDAASHYGKVEEKSYGKYVEKAETYLHEYGQKNSSTNTDAESATHSQHSGSGSTGGTQAPPSSGDGDQGNSGNKYGEYLKTAEGFLKKH